MRRWRNFFILLKYWHILERCDKLMNDAGAKSSRITAETLTLEEMGGVEDLEKAHRLLTISPKQLKKDLLHFEKKEVF